MGTSMRKPTLPGMALSLVLLAPASAQLVQLRHWTGQGVSPVYEGYNVNPDGSFNIILLNQQPVGRIVISRGDIEFRVVDMALLPAFRGRGIGTFLLGDGGTSGYCFTTSQTAAGLSIDTADESGLGPRQSTIRG